MGCNLACGEGGGRGVPWISISPTLPRGHYARANFVFLPRAHTFGFANLHCMCACMSKPQMLPAESIGWAFRIPAAGFVRTHHFERNLCRVEFAELVPIPSVTRDRPGLVSTVGVTTADWGSGFG